MAPKPKPKLKSKAKAKAKVKAISNVKAKPKPKPKPRSKVKPKPKTKAKPKDEKSPAKAKPGDKRLGNKFWLQRSKHGTDKIFSSPENLLNASYEYFQSVYDTPFIENNAVQHKGEQVDLTTEKLNAPTLEGFYAFIDIGESTWYRYKNDEEYKDYWGVTERIQNIMYSHKLSGAAAGLYNASIIARELKLKDLNELSGPDGGPLEIDYAESARARLRGKLIPEAESD